MRNIDSKRPLDAGISMVEVLVASALFGVLGTLLLGFAISTANTSDRVGERADLAGEARLALERMNRELRQASLIEQATLSNDEIAVTFWTDFNGNGAREVNAVDPEVLTYRWRRADRRLTLTANDPDGTAITRPVLAGSVTEFDLELRSSLWQHDGAAGDTPDGVTDWTEIDAAGAPIGNANGVVDPIELRSIDLVALQITVAEGASEQDFVMQADLRNREIS